MLRTVSAAPLRSALPEVAAPEASALVHALVDAAPTGLAIFERDVRFVAIKPALAAMNGEPPEVEV